MPGRTDVELLEALRAGDRDAGAELFSRYAEASREHARRFGAGGDTPDIVQDVWTQILRTPPQLRNDSLAGWLAVTIRNRVLRRQQSRARFETLGSQPLAQRTPPTSPTQQVAHNERLGRIWSAIEAGELSEQDLQLLALKYAGSSTAAGRQLDIPASTFRTRATRALRRVAALVGLDG